MVWAQSLSLNDHAIRNSSDWRQRYIANIYDTIHSTFCVTITTTTVEWIEKHVDGNEGKIHQFFNSLIHEREKKEHAKTFAAATMCDFLAWIFFYVIYFQTYSNYAEPNK